MYVACNFYIDVRLQVMETFGNAVQELYRSATDLRDKMKESDITLNYLGYWTDNGN